MSVTAASSDLPALEAARVSGLVDLRRAMAAIGAMRLLYGPNPLLQLIGPQERGGALSPATARETLTRGARARARRRQLQVRGHNAAALWKLIGR